MGRRIHGPARLQAGRRGARRGPARKIGAQVAQRTERLAADAGVARAEIGRSHRHPEHDQEMPVVVRDAAQRGDGQQGVGNPDRRDGKINRHAGIDRHEGDEHAEEHQIPAVDPLRVARIGVGQEVQAEQHQRRQQRQAGVERGKHLAPEKPLDLATQEEQQEHAEREPDRRLVGEGVRHQPPHLPVQHRQGAELHPEHRTERGQPVQQADHDQREDVRGHQQGGHMNRAAPHPEQRLVVVGACESYHGATPIVRDPFPILKMNLAGKRVDFCPRVPAGRRRHGFSPRARPGARQCFPTIAPPP